MSTQTPIPAPHPEEELPVFKLKLTRSQLMDVIDCFENLVDEPDKTFAMKIDSEARGSIIVAFSLEHSSNARLANDVERLLGTLFT